MLRQAYGEDRLNCCQKTCLSRYIVSPLKDVPDENEVLKIEEAFRTLQQANQCNSLLKKHLTREVMDGLKYKCTKSGATLMDVINSGVQHLDSKVGVYAPDPDSYKIFAALFDPIIQEYHCGFKSSDKQPHCDLGEGRTDDFGELDPDGEFITSTRIRCARSLAKFPFNPKMAEEHYIQIEEVMKKIFRYIQDPDLQCVYCPLENMTSEMRNQLTENHFLFREGDKYLQAANACKYWPKGRGIFHNVEKTFIIWVNEEDHLRIISMQPGSHVGQVLDRLRRGIQLLQRHVEFCRDERLGWLTLCPTNLGTSIRASVHINIANVSSRPDFEDLCDSMKLQIRGPHGENSVFENGICDISNKTRLGINEYTAVKQMYDGVKMLMHMEKASSGPLPI